MNLDMKSLTIDPKIKMLTIFSGIFAIGVLYAQVIDIKEKYVSKEVVQAQYAAMEKQVHATEKHLGQRLDDIKETQDRIYNLVYSQYGAPQ